MTRNRQTGRYIHTWDWIAGPQGEGVLEIGRCDHCGKYSLTLEGGTSEDGHDKVITRAAFQRTYPELAARGL